METRALPIPFELKAVAGREISGYAAAWSKDRVGDIISKTAFDRTIRESPDISVFVGHDASKLPVGEPVEMRADGHGLFTRTQIYATPDGDALLEVARARLSKGKTLGMSIGFRTIRDHWDSKQKARILEEVSLLEYSFLASPNLAANPQAFALGVKSRQQRKALSLEEDSYEDLQGDLLDAANTALGGMCCVVATYPNHVVVMVMQPGDSDGEYYDIPYTLDADKEPTLGTPSPVQRAFVPDTDEPAGKAVMDAAARNSLSDGDYAYVDSNGGKHLPVHDEAHVRAAMSRFNQTHFENPAAKAKAAKKIVSRARSLGIDVSADSAVAQAAKGGPHMTDLDLKDSAFAFIEPGGVLDEEHKTVPRSHRHFQHHDENGDVDVESLKSILADPDLFAHGDEVAAHILRHAQAAGVTRVKIDRDDAHEPQWKGMGARMVVREYQAGLLTEAIGQNYLAYERVGIDTKDGMHVSPKLQKQIADEQEVWTSLVTKAKEIEQGIDGQALVDTWRTAFQLLDLEEVA